MKALFFRLVEAVDKHVVLRAAIGGDAARVRFEVEPSSFSAIPGSPFAYWVQDGVRQTFRVLRPFASEDRDAKQGIATADDFRFVRVWWETPPGSYQSRWLPFVKGGRFASFYSDVPVALGWGGDGRELKAWAGSLYGGSHWSRILKNADMFGQPGLTWPLRGIRFSAQAVPRGCAFSVGGKMAFAPTSGLLAFLALFNSRLWDHLVCLFAGKIGGVQYEVGLIKGLPVPELSREDHDRLTDLARRAWSLKRSLDSMNETSHAFLLPPGPNEKVTGLDRSAVERELADIQREIDEHAYRLYGIGPEDRACIEALANGSSSTGDANEDHEGEDDDASDDEAPITASADTLISWLVGVAFGRFDPRLATSIVKSYRTSGGPPYTLLEGQRPVPPEPEPFDPLPARSPGMWPEDEAPVIVPPDVMVDDPGHDDDIRSHVADAAAATGWPDPADLRPWLAKEFFPLHVRMYSKSRRKAPIYWQLATPSASYSVWLYYQRFTRDTLYRVLNDYVAPKLKHEERKSASLTQDAGPNPSSSQRRELDAQESFVAELRAFQEEIARVAPLWNPDLNDGVIINFAPLWRLVPQNRSWQKECRKVWDKLVAGDYDWAHLAMHLWPERVVPKCAKDRSLAIAHGLEEVFWEENEDGKWQSKKVARDVVARLIEERTAPAVKSALDDLLRAPAPTTTSRARRGGARRGRAKAAHTPASRSATTTTSATAVNMTNGTIDAVKQAIAASDDGASKSDIVEATGISSSEWNAAINALLDQGVVTKTGAARGTRYHLAEEDEHA